MIPVQCMPMLACLCLTLTAAGCMREGNEFVEPPPPRVLTAQALELDVTLALERNGETQAADSAEVRARVRGNIEKVLFDPGQTVHEGQALFEIESDEYRVAKQSAEALVTVAQAAISEAKARQEGVLSELQRAEAEYERFRQLRETNATSQAEFEAALAQRDVARAGLQTAQASIQSAEADLLRAEANLAQAELDLGFTSVKAPIAGRISQTLIDRGNLADNGSVLATITDRSQIYVYFNISDREMLDLQKGRPEEASSGPVDWSQVRVFLRRDDREDNWIKGYLNYIDQQGVDQATGTIALRAVVDNARNLLVPGMFVTVRLPVARLQNALLIPYQAVAHSQAGAFVLCVNADGEVAKRAVELGERVGNWIVVSQGLTRDDTIVLEGLQQAVPGIKVESKPAELSVEDAPELQAMLAFFGNSGASGSPTGKQSDSASVPVLAPDTLETRPGFETP